MTPTLHKEPPAATTAIAAARKFEPLHNVPDRRHSIAHEYQPSPPDLRRGSNPAQRKPSDTPVWLTGMKERNSSVGSNPEHRRSSVADGVKSLFGRRKSHDEGGKKPEEKVVITSKHTMKIRNKLRADPRHAKKAPSGGAVTDGPRYGAFLSAAEQEERRPHSGNPVVHGALPMLTRIVSGDEQDEEDFEDKRDLTSWMKDHQQLEKVHESEKEDRPTPHDPSMDHIPAEQ